MLARFKVGMERPHRTVRCVVPDAEGAPARDDGADAGSRRRSKACGERRSTSGQKTEQAGDPQRITPSTAMSAPSSMSTTAARGLRRARAAGVSVKGAIVISRCGGSFRGTKPKIAAEHGAVGCLIYSDPQTTA